MALLVLKVKAVRPMEDVAFSVTGAALNAIGVTGLKVTVCVTALITTLALAEALE